MKRVMFLPGHVDHCNLIVNLGNLSVFEMPKETILSFSSVLQDNMHFMMAKSFYLNLSWAQSMSWETLKYFLQDSIRQKTILTRDMSHPELLELYHPCQIEERFGGTAKTPTNYWPPYVGADFYPVGYQPD